MSKAPAKVREEALRPFLFGEMRTNVEIARHLGFKPLNIGQWRREED